MYGSRTLDNSDVKENETFLLGLGLISCTLSLLDFIYIWLYHIVCIAVLLFFYFLCFDWLLVKMSILGMWRGRGHSGGERLFGEMQHLIFLKWYKKTVNTCVCMLKRLLLCVAQVKFCQVLNSSICK